MSSQASNSQTHTRQASFTSRVQQSSTIGGSNVAKPNLNIMRQFKYDQTIFDRPKTLSSFKSVSMQNQLKEQEDTLTKLQDKMNASKLPKGSQIEKEKERYQKMPIMLVFDYLKGFFFKSQNENEELKHKIEKLEKGENLDKILKSNNTGNAFSQENEQYMKDLKTTIDKLQFENSKIKMELEKTVKELTDFKAQKKQAMDTSQVIILEIKNDNEKLLKVIDDKNGQIELFKKDIQDRDIQIEKLKEKLVDTSKLQQKVKLLENKYATDINHIKAISMKENVDKKKGEGEHTKLLALNNVKDERILFLENEIKSFRDKVSTDRQTQNQVSKLSFRAEINEKISRKSEHEIARLKIRIEEKDRQIEKIKKDFDRVFEELKKYKKDAEKAIKYESIQGPQGNQMMNMGSNSAQSVIPYIPVDKNPYLLEEYQKKVREQEQVILGMRKKFKRMNLTEKKAYIKQKEFEMQRFEYEREIQDMRKYGGDKKKSHGYLSNGDSDSSLDERGYPPSTKIKHDDGSVSNMPRSSSIQKLTSGLQSKMLFNQVGSQTQRNFKTASGALLVNTNNKDSVAWSNNENLKTLKETRMTLNTLNTNNELGSDLNDKSSKRFGSVKTQLQKLNL
ncbi:UNKNOWN [Stylonychia lemnae]|uniref:Uncharacterized protein n=1 Tax=Stylonychia lemnae TaxID=5949 RepID=A0A078A476_STYLE|nr:UNKNOWN [Stylonychia lemnae]|eukprot:CDW77068.1 UNKNOWN [Stylonychia lemnae]